jgi:Mg-chelatase subunit ChlD
MMFSMSSSGSGTVMQSMGRGPRAGTPPKPGSAAPGETDDEGSVVELPQDPAGVDAAVRARARQIASRLSVRRPNRGITGQRGAGDLVSMRYRGGSDDIDLDATIEVLAERPVPEDEDIIVRERVRTKRSVVLVVDVSGSMRGERVQTAAATVGALAGELINDDLGVIAFWSDAAVLVPIGTPFEPTQLVDLLLRVPAQGLTNVGFPLQIAAAELARKPALDARVLLLSDCVHNAGVDPRDAAARLPRLDVLIDTSGENDVELGRELAAIGRGQVAIINTHRDVAPALTRLFST